MCGAAAGAAHSRDARNMAIVGSALAIFALLGQAESDIKPWLADMCGLKVREFDELPLAQTLDVVEGIVRQEDWPAFLGRLTGMFAGRAT